MRVYGQGWSVQEDCIYYKSKNKSNPSCYLACNSESCLIRSSQFAASKLKIKMCCKLILAWWYMHVSDFPFFPLLVCLLLRAICHPCVAFISYPCVALVWYFDSAADSSKITQPYTIQIAMMSEEVKQHSMFIHFCLVMISCDCNITTSSVIMKCSTITTLESAIIYSTIASFLVAITMFMETPTCTL